MELLGQFFVWVGLDGENFFDGKDLERGLGEGGREEEGEGEGEETLTM